MFELKAPCLLWAATSAGPAQPPAVRGVKIVARLPAVYRDESHARWEDGIFWKVPVS